MMNLIPVVVNQPYDASRSSTAWSSPRSWSIEVCFWRISNISRDELSRNENSMVEFVYGGKRDICNGLSFEDVSSQLYVRCKVLSYALSDDTNTGDLGP
jgi:hypothetical protein